MRKKERGREEYFGAVRKRERGKGVYLFSLEEHNSHTPKTTIPMSETSVCVVCVCMCGFVWMGEEGKGEGARKRRKRGKRERTNRGFSIDSLTSPMTKSLSL